MQKRLWCLLAAVAGTSLSCAPGSGPGASVPGPGGEENCEQFGTVPVNGKEYVVQNNRWNSNQGQCVDAKGTAFTVTQGGFDIATNGPPATYPAIFKGCHW